MSACPMLCREAPTFVRYSAVCPSAPSIDELGLTQTQSKKKYCPFGFHTVHPPLHHSPRPLRASLEPSITNSRQSKSTFDWSKVEFRTRPLSRLEFIQVSVSSTVTVDACRQSIINLALELLLHLHRCRVHLKSVLPGPPFSQSSSVSDFSESSDVVVGPTSLTTFRLFQSPPNDDNPGSHIVCKECSVLCDSRFCSPTPRHQLDTTSTLLRNIHHSSCRSFLPMSRPS